MRTAALCLLFTACVEAPMGEPTHDYQPLSWAEVDPALPRVEGARELQREQLDQTLGATWCLDGADARASLASALKARGWRTTSFETLSPQRLDLTAEREGLLLAGSLTTEPAEGCAQGFIFTVRKVQP